MVTLVPSVDVNLWGTCHISLCAKRIPMMTIAIKHHFSSLLSNGYVAIHLRIWKG
jgi:hypothetical protein